MRIGRISTILLTMAQPVAYKESAISDGSVLHKLVSRRGASSSIAALPNDSMNKLIALISILHCGAATSVLAQYQTAISTGTANVSIPISATQVMQVFNFTHDVDAGSLRLTRNSTTQFVCQSVSIAGSTNNRTPESYFAGPGTMIMQGASATARLCLTYKIFDNSTGAGTTVPSTAVVIPADAAGPVNVILESSTDLVTWTAALPGSYASSTTKRFFRVRAVAE